MSHQVYVNDVPLFPVGGAPLHGSEAKVELELELGRGRNKVELSCLSDRGVESDRALAWAEYQGPVTAELYVLGFGVSKYKDKRLDLKYAAKDAKDLEGTLTRLSTRGFAKVHPRVLTDKAVTVQAIAKAKDFLAKAKVDDTVVLFIAGHGVHDDDPAA